MANEIKFVGGTIYSGETITADVYTDLGVAVGTTVTMTEVGTTGVFLGDMPTAPEGRYLITYLLGANSIATDPDFYWDGAAVITPGSANTDVDLLLKYHDGNTAFFGSDGITPATQADAYQMVTYDPVDGVTEIKRIYFTSAGMGTTLATATGYQSTAP